MYEYVQKSEYAPIRKELEKIINDVQIVMRKKHKLPFQFKLIGSGKRHLVTKICGGNRGYDFDYNLILHAPRKGYQYEAKSIKQNFMRAFENVLKGTQYSFSDSTSAITIKMVDKKKKKIRYSCDFAIIYYGNFGENTGYYYLRNNKKQGTYEFAFRPLKSNIDEKVCDILEHGGWNYIREEYLILKNVNEGNEKHSFSIYIEAVNNVFNQMFLQ